ncbi:TPA: hypothetical protein ACMUBJ_000952 [Enterococcus faecalis]|nr:hypothetical protein [Enterococcus faecalis]
MEEIRDCKGRIACKGISTTGYIEVLYKKCKTSTFLNIGGTIQIERDGIITEITRRTNNEFLVDSYVLEKV